MQNNRIFLGIIFLCLGFIFIPFGVTKAALNNDATLTGLTTTAGDLIPAFSPDQLIYTTYAVKPVASTVTSITVTATAHLQDLATIRIGGVQLLC